MSFAEPPQEERRPWLEHVIRHDHLESMWGFANIRGTFKGILEGFLKGTYKGSIKGFRVSENRVP